MEYYFQAIVSSRYMVDGDMRVNPLVFEVIPTLLHVIVLTRMQSVFIVLLPLEWLSMRFPVRSCLF